MNRLGALRFDNAFIRELPGDRSGKVHSRQTPGVCWASVSPSPVSQPRLLAYAPEVAALLDLEAQDVTSDTFAQVFGGNALLHGMAPYATRYGGHQFGTWAGQLGDGRAISLGEAINARGERWELQLKGAGITPYSRRADGRAVLRSSLREFLCSEAMFHLGVPTTRALSLIATGDAVRRDMLYDGNPRDEPGAVVCRVAPSFIRFGHFEILAAQGEHDLLRRLLSFTLEKHFPSLGGEPQQRFAAWFREVCERTAQLVVEWMRVGFVHGVMNTDNMSILGLTIDYGPYGWIDDFDPGWTPNTTDADMRRYCYGDQTIVARWNLERLAQALAGIAPSQSVLDEGLAHFDTMLQKGMHSMLAGKFGLRDWRDGDAELVADIFQLMQQSEVDMTEFFRLLALVDVSSPHVNVLATAFYHEEQFIQERARFETWLTRYAQRTGAEQSGSAERTERMNKVNPRFVLRNYLAQQAIEAAEQGDLKLLHRLLDAARTPYADAHPADLIAKRPDWARHKAGASMLSCSS
ncbi:MAG: YdiU family protein [Gallionella sp.]|nr:YdiU family protein [Gallionella sp.]